jgi:lactase-phlorizin hydrolase
MKAANLIAAWLLLSSQTIVFVSGIYTDEPLLYSTFPNGFIWAAATSAHQVDLPINFLRFD